MIKDARWVSGDVVMTTFSQSEILLDKHPAVGACILERAKEHLWRVYYTKMVDALGGQDAVRIICGDTGEFI